MKGSSCHRRSATLLLLFAYASFVSFASSVSNENWRTSRYLMARASTNKQSMPSDEAKENAKLKKTLDRTSKGNEKTHGGNGKGMTKLGKSMKGIKGKGNKKNSNGSSNNDSKGNVVVSKLSQNGKSEMPTSAMPKSDMSKSGMPKSIPSKPKKSNVQEKKGMKKSKTSKAEKSRRSAKLTKPPRGNTPTVYPVPVPSYAPTPRGTVSLPPLTRSPTETPTVSVESSSDHPSSFPSAFSSDMPSDSSSTSIPVSDTPSDTATAAPSMTKNGLTATPAGAGTLSAQPALIEELTASPTVAAAMSGTPTLDPSAAITATPTTKTTVSSAPASATDPSSTPVPSATVAVSSAPGGGQGNCIQSYSELSSAIESASTVMDAPTLLYQCPGTIIMSSEIDMSGRSFDLDCAGNEGDCIISGGFTTRLFRGGPVLGVFQNIEFRDASSEYGAAFYVIGGSVGLKGCSLQDNAATIGGAIYVDVDGSLSFNNGTISGNMAKGDGGAIFATFGSVSISDAIIENNIAGIDGGALALDASSFVDLTRTLFRNNTAGLVSL
jgi:hypothetical protein